MKIHKLYVDLYYNTPRATITLILSNLSEHLIMLIIIKLSFIAFKYFV